MNAEIVSIGEELLSSDSETIDTNSVYITRQLGSLGIRVLYKTTVGDDEQRIIDVLRIALARADVIITTGGLGPTVDDMTRQGVAGAIGRALVFQPALLEEIAAKFARFGVRMSDNNRVQAMLPEGARPIDNPVGTAPGFIVEVGDQVIASVPGVPREMKAMLEQTLMPYLRERLGAAAGVQKTRVLRTAGIGESHIDEQIGHLERLQNPTVGLNAHAGQTDIRITARATTEAEADALIAPVEAEIRARIGGFIYGVDKAPLEAAFLAALRRTVGRVAIAEMGSGSTGALRSRIESQPGGAEVLTVIEGDALEDLRARCAQTVIEGDAKALAECAAAALREQTGAGLAIAVVVSDSGSAICVTNGVESRSRGYGYNVNFAAPEWASGWALAMAWRLMAQSEEKPAS